jgi:hypothetical protein
MVISMTKSAITVIKNTFFFEFFKLDLVSENFNDYSRKAQMSSTPSISMADA